MRWLALLSALLLGLTAGTGGADVPGTRLAYIHQGDLYVTAQRAEPARLTRGAGAANPRWSADGRWLTYTTGQELWLASADGRRLQRLVPGFPGAGQAAWAPSGARLAYISGGRLWSVNVTADGPGEPRELHMPAASFAWSPDGSQLVVEEPWQGPWPGSQVPSDSAPMQGGLVVVPAGGGGFRDLLRIPRDPDRQGQPAYPIANLAWSPDGRWITFHKLYPSASLSADGVQLMVIPAAGGTAREVGTMLAYPEWVAWSPGGSALGYIRGAGREAWGGKQFTLAYPPDFAAANQKVITPQGYTDRDFTWAPACGGRAAPAGEPALATARSGPGSPKDQYGRSVPAIWLNGKQISHPEPPFGDYAPHLDCAGNLFWVRMSYDRAQVMLADQPWVEVDLPNWFYGHYHVGEVLDWWEPTSSH